MQNAAPQHAIHRTTIVLDKVVIWSVHVLVSLSVRTCAREHEKIQHFTKYYLYLNIL